MKLIRVYTLVLLCIVLFPCVHLAAMMVNQDLQADWYSKLPQAIFTTSGLYKIHKDHGIKNDCPFGLDTAKHRYGQYKGEGNGATCEVYAEKSDGIHTILFKQKGKSLPRCIYFNTDQIPKKVDLTPFDALSRKKSQV